MCYQFLYKSFKSINVLSFLRNHLTKGVAPSHSLSRQLIIKYLSSKVDPVAAEQIYTTPELHAHRTPHRTSYFEKFLWMPAARYSAWTSGCNDANYCVHCRTESNRYSTKHVMKRRMTMMTSWWRHHAADAALLLNACQLNIRFNII